LDEPSRHHNEKASHPLLQQLMRNGDAATAAPAPTVVSRRLREFDPDLVIFLVMVSTSLDFMLLASLYAGFPAQSSFKFVPGPSV
jgi:hypothetical protein